MQTKKTTFSRVIATMISVILVLMMVPITVSAAPIITTNVTINQETNITNFNINDYGIKAEVSNDKNTLTLSFGNDGKTNISIFFSPITESILKISGFENVLVKTINPVTISCNGANTNQIGFFKFDLEVTNITFDADFTVDCGSSCPMYFIESMGGTVNISDSNIVINNKLNNVVTADYGSIIITNSKITAPNVGDVVGKGLHTEFGDIKIDSSKISFGGNELRCGIDAGGSIDIVNGSNITIEGTKDLTGAIVAAESINSSPVVYKRQVNISDSTINIKNCSYGIYFNSYVKNDILPFYPTEKNESGVFIDNSQVTIEDIKLHSIYLDSKLSVSNSSLVILKNHGDIIFVDHVWNDYQLASPISESLVVDNTSEIRILNESFTTEDYEPVVALLDTAFDDDLEFYGSEDYDVAKDNCSQIFIAKLVDFYDYPGISKDYKTVYVTGRASVDPIDPIVYYEVSTTCPTVTIAENNGLGTCYFPGQTVHFNGVIGNTYMVKTTSGNVIGRYTSSGSFTMPADGIVIVEDVINSGSAFAINKNVFCKSYVTEYDAQNNMIKKVASRNSGEIKLDFGKEYANKTVTVYEGKGTTKEYTTVTLDSKGKATISVENGMNYTAVVTD